MTWRKIPFTGQAYTERSRQANAQECINFYPVKSPMPDDPKRVILAPTPGFSLVQDPSQLGFSGTGEFRGLFELNGIVYFVSGTQLIEATPSGSSFTYASVGTLYTSTGRCSIVCNSLQLGISDGTYGYTYTLSTRAFAGISGGSWPTGGVTNLAFLNSKVFASPKNTSRIIQSDVRDASTFNALAYQDIASFGDSLTAIYSDQLRLYAFGPKQGEVLYDAGTTPFSLQKAQGALIEAGCVSPHTMVKMGGTLIWLAADSQGRAFVAALDGYTPKVLSNAALNETFQRYSTVADAYAIGYREGDTQFYCITFPSQNVTWCCDTKTQAWHQRSYQGGRDLPSHCTPYRDKQLVGGTDGKLYWMSQDYLDDGSGNGLSRVRTAAHNGGEGKILFLREVEVEMEVGLVPLGLDPKATLEVSTDRGITWKSLGVKSIGLRGETRKRVVWRNGAWGNDITLRLTITDAVAPFIYGARARATASYK